ncbi:histidine phosphatase family protein [Shimia sp.]|uniref:SixA phosphatase family protein n=1 Tax=Shimia sp. TaxID=1954381 RepID=UPI0032989F29
MALNLILVRHAKSSWHILDQSDHDRPLNQRGRASAAALGDWVRKEEVQPDQVLCSSAQRTRETFERMRLDAPLIVTRSLYLASVDTMLAQLQTAQGASVMMIGHNPGIGELAYRLAQNSPSHPRFGDYPTGATTVFQFNSKTWPDVKFGQGEVRKFVIPRDLIS